MNRSHKLSISTVSLLMGALLSAVLLFSAVPRAHAEDIDRCQRRIAHAELRRLETAPPLGPAPRRSALRENRRLLRAERRRVAVARERPFVAIGGVGRWRRQH